MDLDLGCRIHNFTKIRLDRYDAAEMNQINGPEAKTAAHNLLTSAKEIVVETRKTRYGIDYSTHDRWLAAVYVDGADLAQILLKDDFVRPYPPTYHSPNRGMEDGRFESLRRWALSDLRPQGPDIFGP